MYSNYIAGVVPLKPKATTKKMEAVKGPVNNDPSQGDLTTISADKQSSADNFGTMDIGQKIVDAYAVAQALAVRTEDPAARQKLENGLVRSGVHGSAVMGITGQDDVVTMLSQVTNWREVVATLKDREITAVYQGELPAKYSAFAGYATIREIGQVFGQEGLDTVKPKIGFFAKDEYYLGTTLRFPTRLITVQLKATAETRGLDYLVRWFAGYEVSSIVRKDEGDTNVRCGVVITPRTVNRNQREDARPKTHRYNGAY